MGQSTNQFCFRSGVYLWSFYPESSVIFHHNVCKVDPLSPANELSDLWMVVCPDVVAHKVPVDAVSSAFFLVQQDVGCWNQKIT